MGTEGKEQGGKASGVGVRAGEGQWGQRERSRQGQGQWGGQWGQKGKEQGG